MFYSANTSILVILVKFFYDRSSYVGLEKLLVGCLAGSTCSRHGSARSNSKRAERKLVLVSITSEFELAREPNELRI
jgi:hypothetical protein